MKLKKLQVIKSKILLILMLFLLTAYSHETKAQTISNGSFETYTACPTHSQLQLATGWIQPTLGTPDLLVGNGSTCSFKHGSNANAAEGVAYIGLCADSRGRDYKEYATTNLSSPMINGVTYTISFKVYRPNGSYHTFNPPLTMSQPHQFQQLPASERGYLGLVFSTAAPTKDNTNPPPPPSPVSSAAGQTSIVNSFGSGRSLIASTHAAYTTANAWVPVTLTYLASGGEEYMTVGQFRPGASTIPMVDVNGLDEVYYLYDDFSISAVRTIVSITPLTQSVACNASATPIKVIAAGTGTLSYQWYSNSTNSNTGGTAISGANTDTYTPPTSAGGTKYYYVVVTDSGGSSTSQAVEVKVANCTGPGGVTTGLLMWHKANDGINTTPGATAQWNDVSGNEKHVIQATAANRPLLTTDAYYTANDKNYFFNFNPSYYFDGTNDNFYRIGTTGDYFSDATKAGSVYGVMYSSSNTGWRTPYGWGDDSPNLVKNGEQYELWRGGGNTINTGSIGLNNAPAHIGSMIWKGTGGANNGLYLNINGKITSSSTLNIGTIADGIFAIGSEGWSLAIPGAGNEQFQGSIPEVFAYGKDQQNNITDNEKLRINSYLAVKYGITLTDEAGTGVPNYLSSNSTVVWNATANSTYNNNIFGITNDALSALHQKQSRSANQNQKLIIGNGSSLANTNLANSNNLTDGQFLIVGDNGLKQSLAIPFSYTNAVNGDANFRFQSVWKAQNTGNVGTVTVAWPKGVKNLYLVQSADAAFGSGNTFTPMATEVTINGVVYNTATATLANGQFFTFAGFQHAPGGVTSAVWYRADDVENVFSDAGTTQANDNQTVGQWNEFNNKPFPLTQTTVGSRPTFSSETTLANFNPTVAFTGGRYLDYRPENYGNNYMIDRSEGALFGAGSAADNNGMFGFGLTAANNEMNDPGLYRANNNLLLFTRKLSALTNDTDFAFPTTISGNYHIGGGTWKNGAGTGSADTNNRLTVTLMGHRTTHSNNVYNVLLDASRNNFVVGRDADWFSLAGQQNEMIVFGNQLTETEMTKVESYLAIKWGMTLSKTQNRDYLSSDGVAVWDATANTDYYHNVFGVARDNISAFEQKISKSVNTGSILTVATIDDFVSSNLKTTRTGFANDKTYFLLGDNNVTTTPLVNLTIGGENYKKIQREWLSQRQNTSGSLFFQADLSAYGVNFGLLNDVVMIIADDEDFTVNVRTISGANQLGKWVHEYNFDAEGNKQYITYGIKEEQCLPEFVWSSPVNASGNTATGTINGIGYTYTSNKTVYTSPQIFNSYSIFPASVESGDLFSFPRTAHSVIRNLEVSSNTLTFASPVKDPVLVFSSLGNAGAAVPVTFGQPVEVLWMDYQHSGTNFVTWDSSTQITGKEGYAIVRIPGTHSSISFDYTATENYANFLFGVAVEQNCDPSAITDVSCSNNGTFEDSTDDFMIFKLTPSSTIQSNYNVTATFGGNPVSVFLMNDAPANNVVSGVSTYFKVSNGSLGTGDFTITITPTVGSPEVLTVANTGTCSTVCSGASTGNKITHYFYSPYLATDLINYSGIIPKFNEGSNRKLTNVKVDYGIGFKGIINVDNQNAISANARFEQESEVATNFAGHSFNQTVNVVSNPNYPSNNLYPSGITKVVNVNPATANSVNYSSPTDLVNFIGAGNVSNNLSATATLTSFASSGVILTSETYASYFYKVEYTYDCIIAKPDIVINKIGPISAQTGSTISYDVVVTNHGPNNAVNVIVKDPAVANFTATGITCTAGAGIGGTAVCPSSVTIAGLQGASGLTIPSLPEGSGVTFTITGTVGNIAGGATIANTATVEYADDANTTNNSSTVNTSIYQCLTEESVYTVDSEATKALASNAINANGGVINMVYKLTSGPAVPGIGNEFTQTVTYSDLNNNFGIDNQWEGLDVATFGTSKLFVLSPKTSAGAGRLYNNLPGNNTTNESVMASNNRGDNIFTSKIEDGNLDELGRFTISIGNFPAAPAGYVSTAGSFRVYANGNTSYLPDAATATANSSGFWLKPLIQTGIRNDGSEGVPPIYMMAGNTYEWRYSAFSNGTNFATNYFGTATTARGVLFYHTNSITFAKSPANCLPCSQVDVLEFASGDGNPTGNGPVQNTNIRFRDNTNNPAGNTFQIHSPAVTVNFELTNQRYSLAGISTGRPVNIGYRNDSGGSGASIFSLLSSYGAPLNSWFTSYESPVGTGIATNSNNGILLNTITSPLRAASAATSGVAHPMTDLVITFSEPVNNPIIHLGGMGSRSSYLGYSQEYDIISSNVPVSLTRLSGSNVFTVNGNNIRNTAVTGQMDSGGTDKSGSGSIRINGIGITTITLQVSVRGDGTSVSSTAWSDTDTFRGQGDGATISFSIGVCGSACYRPGATTGGTTLDTKMGITSLARAGADDADNWPMARKGGWIALESKTKGFVPNRVKFNASNQPVADDGTTLVITSPVEGMMVYDTINNCMKMYTLKAGDTLPAWHCISTQTCPE